MPGMFVCHKSARDNTVTLGEESSLYSDVLLAEGFNLISRESLDGPLRVKAMTRYRQAGQLATVEADGPDRVRVTFDEPQRAVAPGQAIVLYEDDVVLGGGTIVSMR
jgi:tRNA-specific 2-thiouridylase